MLKKLRCCEGATFNLFKHDRSQILFAQFGLICFNMYRF